MADPGEMEPLPYAVLNESRRMDDAWLHNPCGSILLTASVVHSVWDGPGISGHGQVQTQQVPYCPECHEKPSSYGAPIRPSDTEWPKVPLRPKVAAHPGRNEPDEDNDG